MMDKISYIRTINTYENADAVHRFAQTMSSQRIRQLPSFVCEALNGTPPGARILDIGSGTGVDVHNLRGRGYDAYGIDISQAMVDYATQNYGPYFSIGDVRNIGSKIHKKFDVVICIAVLLHIQKEHVEGVISEIKSTMRDGGTLLLSTKEGGGEYWDTRLGYQYPRYTKCYKLAEIEEILFRAGFKVYLIDIELKTRPPREERWIVVSAKMDLGGSV